MVFNVVNDFLPDLIHWIRQDYRSYRLRFLLEVSAWVLSIGCALTMAMTVPHPPFMILYPLWITQCVIFGWSAWTRKSFGMVSNFVLLISIDSTALIRMVG